MILYIDETGNDDFFIVAGVLFDSEESTKSIYKQFKKKVDNIPLKNSAKEKVYTEFKGTLLEKSFQRIKQIIMETINNNAIKIVYSIYRKNKSGFLQNEKEMVYFQLINNIVNSMNEPVDVVFDEFKIKSFDSTIENRISQNANCNSIIHNDSQLIPGLQFADNVCGAIRLYVSEENEKYYMIVKDKTYSV